MISDITLGQYFPGNSPLHKMDPRVKIILTFVYVIMVFVADNSLAYMALAVFLVTAVKISRISAKNMLKGLKSVLFIIAFTAAFNIFLAGGESLFEIGPVSISKQGIYTAIMMIARVFFLITGTTLLTFTTSPIRLTDGIEHLLKPFSKIGLPSHELAMMMSIALRFIPTLIEETDKIMKAQAARGADFESGGLIKRAKSFVPLLVPLFVSAFRRADDLAIAMECRCYKGGEGRTRLVQLSLHRVDLFACLLTLVFLVLVILTR